MEGREIRGGRGAVGTKGLLGCGRTVWLNAFALLVCRTGNAEHSAGENMLSSVRETEWYVARESRVATALMGRGYAHRTESRVSNRLN